MHQVTQLKHSQENIYHNIMLAMLKTMHETLNGRRGAPRWRHPSQAWPRRAPRAWHRCGPLGTPLRLVYVSVFFLFPKNSKNKSRKENYGTFLTRTVTYSISGPAVF